MPHRQHHLDDASDAGGGLGVPDVRLDRSQPERLVIGPVLTVGRQQRLGLDRVAQRRPGAVRLHRVDLTGRQTRVRQRLADHPLLRGTVGSRQTVARTVLVHRTATHHRQHRVTLALGVRQPLDEQHADALTPAGAVGRRREGLAAAVGREPALAAERDERTRRGHHRRTARERHGALTAAQGLHRQVQGHERGGARGVDGDRRALQAEGVRESAGDDARRVAGAEIAAEVVRGVHRELEVVLPVGADEDAGPAAAQGRRVDAGALDRLPGRLQQQPLLGVHRQRLTRRDPEEGRVELGHVVEEPAVTGVGRVRLVGTRTEQRLQIPAAVGREAGDRVGAGGEQLPQLLGGADAAGESAAHRDDGDRLVVDGGRRGGREGGQRLAEQLRTQVLGQRGRGRVVEDQCGGQGQTGRRAQEVAELDGGQRVEAELAERLAGLDGLRVAVAQHRGHVAADHVEQGAVPLGLGQSGQAVGQRGGPADGGGGRGLLDRAAGLGQLVEEAAGACGDEGRSEALPVQVGGDHRAVLDRERALEEGQAQLGRHGPHSAPAQTLGQGLVGGHAALGPGTPGDGRGRKAVGPALLDERVQVGVGSGVVALSRTADRAGDRGEQHERGQAVGEFVQVACRLHLGAGDSVEALGGQAVHDAVVEDTGGVEDGRDRVVQ